tara:strand:+ start:1815 stop:2528 length:714 start_codon:yes stop_codon:yes gene_type:complete
MTEVNQKEFWDAMRLAQMGLESVSKDATNDWGKYGYTSAEEMISKCRQTLLRNNLVFSRTNWELVDEKVCSEFIIVHSGSGQNVKFSNQMIFVGGKNPDKSVLAALTTSMNYMLRDLLLIPRIDGQPEIDNRKSDAISSSSASFRQKKAPDILNETAKELPKAPSWMVNSFSLVLGQKDDPKDFAARLLSAAVSKYDKPFDRVDDLPEEYLRRVFEHHGWVISVEDQKVRKESEDAK